MILASSYADMRLFATHTKLAAKHRALLLSVMKLHICGKRGCVPISSKTSTCVVVWMGTNVG